MIKRKLEKLDERDKYGKESLNFYRISILSSKNPFKIIIIIVRRRRRRRRRMRIMRIIRIIYIYIHIFYHYPTE